MKKITLLFSFLPYFTFAQIQFTAKVIDAATKLPLTNVNVEHLASHKIVQTDQHGMFTIFRQKESDSIKISFVGYLDKIVETSKATGQSYELTPAVFQLRDVRIGYKVITKELGVTKKRGHKMGKLSAQLNQMPLFTQAVFMENDGSYKKAELKRIHFYMGSDLFYAPFSVNIHQNEDGESGQSIISMPIIYQATTKDSWNELDLSERHLTVPEKGFWVSVEWIADEKYSAQSRPFKRRMQDGTINEKYTQTYYGPEIVSSWDTGLGITYYKSSNGWWNRAAGTWTPALTGKTRPSYRDLMVKSTIEVIE